MAIYISYIKCPQLARYFATYRRTMKQVVLWNFLKFPNYFKIAPCLLPQTVLKNGVVGTEGYGRTFVDMDMAAKLGDKVE